ncbi:MAG: ATP-binding protein [Algoriphagus sp.]|uniref:ATP-binding protein n=1 Tax=Algoriphagus sp. TaxID=1872435 RepID=UPI002730CF78|nr:ATP-binding protein [Algoriphagus sp.]MDP2040663.1 ATP-binding protein [Algoriphagus sp.]MDP3471795.1 ATP-binding protein [Algoriphagus sp.]
MILRRIEDDFNFSFQNFPVTGLIGPRQVGKTTLAKSAVYPSDSIYLDLEKTSDLNKIDDPELFFTEYHDKTIILDEIQHVPNLFPLIRSMVDEKRRPGKFVILGSASPELLRQSAESLAGRINYLEMTPLNLLEINQDDQNKLWLMGGFPEPFLHDTKRFTTEWYKSFIASYVQRDLPNHGLPADPSLTRKLLMMIASSNGGILNYSTFGKSLGLTIPTIKTYLNFLIEAFLVREIPSWHMNIKKRLVKSPKLFYRDTGMLHNLLGISSLENLFGNIVLGNSWETFVINQVFSVLYSDDEIYFYRTQDGAEIDLLIRRNNRWLAAAEIKFSSAPVLTKGTYIALQDLGVDLLHVIVPKAEDYPLAKNVRVIGLRGFLEFLENTK